jgi:hypothetical protein
MTDFDAFERRLAAAIRADADVSVGEFTAESVAQAAIAGDGLGAARIPRAMSRHGGRFGRGRGVTLLAAAALVLIGGALAVGSGIVRLPAIVPPAPVPSIALDAAASPEAATTPTPSAVASPTAIPSLDLTWTQVPLDEQDPHVAWVGDRFVLVDAKSGAVRTSTDGQNWQALPPGDVAQGYVSLLRGDFVSSQDSAAGWWNPEDGPDYAGKPPITARDILTTIDQAGGPVSTTPFKGRIESIGVGPRGIVAEVHSALDTDAWVTHKLGLRTNNDWTMHVKSVTFRNGVLQIRLTNRPGLKVVWADQGFEPGDLWDAGFGWFSPDGEHWTEMAPRDNSDLGSTLPTGGFGQVVGVSDGFIATGGYPDGACADPNGSCAGMWYSPDGLSWRLLGTTAQSVQGMTPWREGVLVTDGDGHGDFWTSGGSAASPITAQVHGAVATGPLGLVSIANGQVLVSRNGIDYKVNSIPTQMDEAQRARRARVVAVGDRNVLVLEWARVDDFTTTPSLWLGTFGQ